MESVMSNLRDEPIDAKYFKKIQKPLDKRYEKAIYCTGWDGTVELEGKSNGDWVVKKLHGNPAFSPTN
jgi:hypothetical protein